MTTVQQRNPARFIQVRTFAATVILLAAASFSNQAIAQQRPNTQKPIRPVVLLPRIGVIGEVPLTLKEVIAHVLAANKDIEGSRIDQHIASLQLVGAKGHFDPVIGAQGRLERQVSPVSSSIGGGAGGKLEQRDFTTLPQINGLVPWLGGSYRVSLTSTRLTTDNQFNTLNPQYPTALTFNFNQPLFRNLLFDDNRRSIEVAKKNRSLSDEQFCRRVIDTITQAEQAYWELVFAVRNLQVQTEAADLARRQVESNQRMVDQGILAPVDVVEAETQLATFAQNVYRAQESVTRAENALKTLMLPNRRATLWASALQPVTPVNLEAPPAALAEAVHQAMTQRPELAQIKLSKEINQANTRFFKEQTKPQVDLIASYTSTGLAGKVIPNQSNPLTGGFDVFIARINDLSRVAGLPALPPLTISGGGVPDILVGGYSQSYSNLWNRNFPTAQIGVSISLPLRNRTAEANLGASLAEERRTGNDRERLEQLVEADVRNALQGVESAKARLASATDARRSAEEQYESEQRQFRAGTSTVFLVLQRQTVMISARSQELRAQVDLSQTIAEFQRSTASTLQAHNITLLEQNTPASK